MLLRFDWGGGGGAYFWDRGLIFGRLIIGISRYTKKHSIYIHSEAESGLNGLHLGGFIFWGFHFGGLHFWEFAPAVEFLVQEAT